MFNIIPYETIRYCYKPARSMMS